jgi:hypothetical protein
MQYLELTADESEVPTIQKVLRFLATGVNSEGAVYYECGNHYRYVAYHTAVTAAALVQARQLKIDDYDALADRCYRYLVGLQQADGGFRYSRGDYRLLSDCRSYPRYLAMIMLHLLQQGRAVDAPTDPQTAVAP